MRRSGRRGRLSRLRGETTCKRLNGERVSRRHCPTFEGLVEGREDRVVAVRLTGLYTVVLYKLADLMERDAEKLAALERSV
jgi:hypothetical protein